MAACAKRPDALYWRQRPTSVEAVSQNEATMMYPQVSLHIDGAWVKGAGGKSEPVLNPATGDPIGDVPHADKADLDRALAAAEKGYKAWRKVSAYDRYKLMRKAADIFRSRIDGIAKIMTME